MLRFCVKAFALGTALAALSFGLLFAIPKPAPFMLALLLIWPTEIFMMTLRERLCGT